MNAISAVNDGDVVIVQLQPKLQRVADVEKFFKRGCAGPVAIILLWTRRLKVQDLIVERGDFIRLRTQVEHHVMVLVPGVQERGNFVHVVPSGIFLRRPVPRQPRANQPRCDARHIKSVGFRRPNHLVDDVGRPGLCMALVTVGRRGPTGGLRRPVAHGSPRRILLLSAIFLGRGSPGPGPKEDVKDDAHPSILGGLPPTARRALMHDTGGEGPRARFG